MNLSELIASLPHDDFELLWSALTTPSVAARRPVPRWKIKDSIYRAGAWPALQKASATEGAVQGVAATCVAYLTDPDFENLDLDLPEVQYMLGQLGAAEILTPTLLQSLFALGDTLVTPLDAHGLAPSRYEAIVAWNAVRAD
jgi:hypothetical protein